MDSSKFQRRVIGRYMIHSIVGTGGMATVYLARQRGAANFTRVVAIKALHPHLLREPEVARMFADEARLAARIRHPNVVATLDVIEADGELLQVQEWIEGESLAALAPTTAAKHRSLVPVPIALAILSGILAGLHGAHEAKDEQGAPLGLVHRDVSPQNVMVGATDGIARVLDFGVAKAAGRLHTTKDGRVRGKLRYMPAEQLQGAVPARANDIYGAGVILWELLTGLPMIEPADEGAMVTQVLTGIVEPPSRYREDVSSELDEVVLRALDRDPAKRFPTAREMATALVNSGRAATAFEVAEWVTASAGDALATRARLVAESSSDEVHERPSTESSAGPMIEGSATDGSVSRPITTTVSSTRRPRVPGFALALVGIAVVLLLIVTLRGQGGGRVSLPSAATTPSPATAVPDAEDPAPAFPSSSATSPTTVTPPASSSPPPTVLVSPPASGSATTSAVTRLPAARSTATPASSARARAPAPVRDGTEDWK